MFGAVETLNILLVPYHGLGALLPMASTRKELALLGGTFLFGYGALEMVLRMGGY